MFNFKFDTNEDRETYNLSLYDIRLHEKWFLELVSKLYKKDKSGSILS